MALSKELKVLVHDSVFILGRIIASDLGEIEFRRIEQIRKRMAGLRGLSLDRQSKILRQEYDKLSRLKSPHLGEIAKSFTLMLELMNACENAYRTHRLSARAVRQKGRRLPEKIIYVLTAHPTEARAPQNIFIFHKIQRVLVESLKNFTTEKEFSFSLQQSDALKNLLEIAWRAPIVRDRAPQVRDEAEHIYSMLFRDDVILSLLDEDSVSFFVRSWVGGDKDGHPGVNEKTLMQSLNLSRQQIVNLMDRHLAEVASDLELIPVRHPCQSLRRQLRALRLVRAGDLVRILKFIVSFKKFQKNYVKKFKFLDIRLKRISRLIDIFPALVVPLELRESSDVLMTDQKIKSLAIYKMLLALRKLSGRQSPIVYARGFIISMAASIDHIRMAAHFQKLALGRIYLPIIPLFEQTESLNDSGEIMRAMTSDRELVSASKKFWQRQIEMMVGYSDSAKEAGVLESRLKIAEAMPPLEKICLAKNLKPIFFHGSGGSIDRGGGSIEDQTAWWPKTALLNYKVTVQGEMVERSLANPVIAKRQIENIAQSVSKRLSSQVRTHKDPILDRFAEEVSRKYRSSVNEKNFLDIVERATPYSYLNFLKIGSRPTKRSKTLTVSGLRAIPWVLCWTQTRVLFQTWWGVGSAWQKMSPHEKSHLKKSLKAQPVFHSYIRALGFTLAKVELAVWKMYLQQSKLSEKEALNAYKMFEAELKLTQRFYRDMNHNRDFMWEKEWLGESIQLRSPMIHPLNLIQILAQKSRDPHLLRLTVTGISSGMMTTG